MASVADTVERGNAVIVTQRRGAAVVASAASAAACGQPIPGYGRPGGGVRPDHPALTGHASGARAVTFMMRLQRRRRQARRSRRRSTRRTAGRGLLFGLKIIV